MAKQKATEYKIDTVSNLFPALGGHVYRQCAVFKEPVDLALLRKAVCSLSEAFPIMCSHLRKTFFSYVHEKATDLDVVNIGDTVHVKVIKIDEKGRIDLKLIKKL